MRTEFKLENLKQLKEFLEKLDENKPIEFKTIDNLKFEFYGIAFGGTVSDGDKSATIEQSVVLKQITK